MEIADKAGWTAASRRSGYGEFAADLVCVAGFD
jgi:hypothetical protein